MADPYSGLSNAQDKAVAALKVLIGAAWADGQIQPEELPALKQAVVELDLVEHPEIRAWIRSPSSPEDYRRCLSNYLALHPTQAERQELLNLVTKVIYSDDEVSVEEAYILDEMRTLLNDLEVDDHIPRLGEFQALFSRLLHRIKA
jgi:uncharacterized tellurite resistance protein B-like protein